MSDATVQVKFPDGEIRYSTYQGSSDGVRLRLHETLEVAWAERRNRDEDGEPEGEAHAVEVCSDYGKGFWWRGTATKSHLHYDSSAPFGLEGWGEWFIEPVETHDGHPDWWLP